MGDLGNGAYRIRSSRGRAATGDKLSSRDRLGLAALAVGRARRDAVARVRRSRLLRWRYRTGIADDIVISPTSLRTADASFADELAVGGFGLDGYVVQLDDGSPFAAQAPSASWLRSLHGFGWLRHLEAAHSNDARETARKYVQAWLRLGLSEQHAAWAPEVTARRIISWLTHETLLLDWAEPRDHDAIMRSLEQQVTYLRMSWRDALDGYPRLLALIGLVHADLCIGGQDDHLAQSQRQLAEEFERQVLADGAHLSRQPWVGVELLLDMLPLRPCFPARERTIDPRLSRAIDRMMSMLHHLRLGDGSLARFNGMGAAERGALTTVLGYAAPAVVTQNAAHGPSGYVRLARGRTIAVVDAGKPGAFELAGAAHAGCLSFELSVGTQLLFVNSGAPLAGEAVRRAVARATASHNTLCLGDQSSAKLIRNERLELQLGAPPLSQPNSVACEVSEDASGIAVVATHDGYADRFGLNHSRFMALSADGDRLAAKDKLAAAAGELRLARDLPFAIHFHLHPDVIATLVETADAADLLLPNGEHWRLSVSGAVICVEESLFIAHPAGPQPSEQVVLRGLCGGSSEVTWVLERCVKDAPNAPVEAAAPE